MLAMRAVGPPRGALEQKSARQQTGRGEFLQLGGSCALWTVRQVSVDAPRKAYVVHPRNVRQNQKSFRRIESDLIARCLTPVRMSDMASPRPQALTSAPHEQLSQLNRDLSRFWILVCRQALAETTEQWAIEI